ncbi:MAG TPA: PTS sugar transporter subunit IIA [Opitutaceae bacterium]|nr:PTS sugar transporter subunit IIA [Opitutaceae bacterium]
MYLNLIQLAESFGVSEKVVEDWIHHEGLPHTLDRGRLLFDRTQVATWAASRGLAAQAGFLAPQTPAFTTSWRLEHLLRTGGIWRNVSAAEVPGIFEKIVAVLPGTTPAIRQLLTQRLRAEKGVTFAPVGGGFALPHPGTRIAFGRDSGVVAILLLREPLPLAEPVPDDVPVARLIFFIAPSSRAHLDLLGRLSRTLARGPLRELLAQGASDAEIFRAMADADASAPAVQRETPS